MKRTTTVLAIVAMAAIAITALSANAAVVPVTGVTGHDGGNWGPWNGHLTDMLNGIAPGTFGPNPADHKPGMDTSADPADPSTWKYAGNDWKEEWKANSRLDPLTSTNAKIGWASIDLGSVASGLDKMYLWNVRFQSNTENVDTFNVYYSSGIGIDALPAMPQSKQTTGDYDFSSGDWTLLNAGGVLTLPQNTSNNNTPQLAVDLAGNSARYIGIEIITAGSSAAHRVGLAEVEITPEPATMALLGIGGLMVLRRRRRS